MRCASSLLSLVFLLLCSAMALGAPQQTPPQQSPQQAQPAGDRSAQDGQSDSPSQAPGIGDPALLEPFFDGLMASEMKSRHVVGGTVSVVSGGRLVFSKGYGHADLEAEKEVDPARTLFRVGSVSKLFTWTSVMQLAEQGRLDLDADVNQYLETFQIPETFPEPVTLKHLLTHTPGFEDVVIGLFSREEDTRPLAEVLASDIPKRVRPPGVQAAYSNWGTALAGLIVANVSGQRFEAYVEEHILQPLGMTYASLRQPPPEDLAEHMSKGYNFEGGEFVAKDFEHVPMSPAGAVSASAEAMVPFMLAHLGDGAVDGQRILQPQTVQQMRQELFRPHPQSNAMLYGFIEERAADPHIYGHGGDTLWFHTNLVLIPSAGTGIFVSFNSTEGGGARGDVSEAFLERFFPYPEQPDPKPSQDLQSLQRFAGTYTTNRTSETTMAKLGQLLFTISITVDDDGYLVMRSPLDGEVNRFAPVERLVFQHVKKPDRLIFEQDSDGQVQQLYLSNLPIMVFPKLGGLQTPSLHFWIIGLSLVCMLAAVVLWPLTPLFRRDSESTMAARRPEAPWWPALLGWTVSLIFLLFVVGFAISMSDPNSIVFGIPDLLRTVLWLPLIGGFLTLFLLAALWMAWRHSYWGILRRLHFTLLTLFCFAFLWVLNYWNLLGV
ncbi:MAG TPA: serine hydrolase domain-containing protein [Acidobacteriota bacterium]|nr:serine hydrolase domain-containing protein [Acidobacteriota bacterium]